MVEYSIETREGYLEVILTGPADIQRYLELLNKIVEYESWTQGTPVLLNQADLDAAPLTASDIRAIANGCGNKRETLGVGNLAMLVARNLEFGTNRMWQVFVEDQWDVVVKQFRSRNEAVAWLTA